MGKEKYKRKEKRGWKGKKIRGKEEIEKRKKKGRNNWKWGCVKLRD